MAEEREKKHILGEAIRAQNLKTNNIGGGGKIGHATQN